MNQEYPSPRAYTQVFLALLVLLVVTVGLAFVDLNRLLPGSGWGAGLALTIAVAKAALIVLYFMHVKGGPTRVAMFACAGFLWLGIMVVLTMSDYVTRHAPPLVNPKGEPRFLEAAADHVR